MNRARRAIALLIVLAMLAGCGTVSSGGSDGGSSTPRVRCQTDPTRDAKSTSSPMVFLFCYESP